MNDGNVSCSDVTDCKSIATIIEVLINYHKWNESNQNNIIESDDEQHSSIIPSLANTSKCNYISLMNDFHHVIEHHCNIDLEFEYIFNSIANELKCDIVECRIMSRSHAKNEKFNSVSVLKHLYNGHCTHSSINELLFLDNIHNHFLHCYDLGFRLKTKEMMEFVQHDEQIINISENKTNVEIGDSGNLSITGIRTLTDGSFDHLTTDPEIISNVVIDEQLTKITEKMNILQSNFVQCENIRNRFRTGNRYASLLRNNTFSNKKKENISKDDEKENRKHSMLFVKQCGIILLFYNIFIV